MSNDESLIAHIAELRQTLIKCFASLFLALLPAIFVAPKALDLFIEFLIGNHDLQFNFFGPTEVFFVQMKLALVLAIVLSFPYMAKKIWDFILPALYENEQKYIKKVTFLSSVLFVCGVLFCLFILLPMLINFALGFSSPSLEATLGIANIINLALWLSLSFGMMFQLPIIVRTLINCDLVSYETLKDKRPYVVVLLLILAAILTPPDIISQILLFLPTYLLFELGLLLSSKKKAIKEDDHQMDED